jgi:ubiquinone/menaquinone biosynthesis C-methylase UbiE
VTSPSRVQEEFTRQAETLSVAAAFTDVGVLERIRAAVTPTQTMRILDVGCGPGILAAALAPRAGEVVGCDLTPEMLERARQRCHGANLQNVRFNLGRAESLPFADGSFDVVVTRATLHHFPDPQLVVGEMARVTVPRGRVVVADVVSSENADHAELHNALEILRDPSHVRMLSSSEILGLIGTAGLRVAGTSTWEMPREFDEWLRITNAPERRAPLLAVMRALAQAGIRAGIDLAVSGNTLVFKHQWLLVTAEKSG